MLPGEPSEVIEEAVPDGPAEEVVETTAPAPEAQETTEPVSGPTPVVVPPAELQQVTPQPEAPPEVPTPRETKLVVSHVVTGFAGVANREIIELYNNSDEELDLTGWCVLYKSSSLTERRACLQPRDAEAQYVALPARSYLVLVSSALVGQYPGFAYDGLLQNDGLAETRGSVVVHDAGGVYVDGVAWGAMSPSSARVDAVEGSAIAGQPARGQALERKARDGRSYQDTDDNANDFVIGAPREVYQAGALRDIADVCANLPGIQEQLPEGYYRDAAGDCSDAPPPSPPEAIMCDGVSISEIGANLDEQFVEVRNHGATSAALGGCQLQTNRNKNVWVFEEGATLEVGEHRVVLVADTDLTLTKTTTGTVYLLSSDGNTEVDSVEYRNLAKESSWALVDGEWQQTYRVTPGASNVYQQYLDCDEGYLRNEATGRCNKIPEPTTLSDCGEGRERNPLSGRCRNIPTPTQLTPCREGQYRSEETNRCRSIATAAASVLKPCADDQFRNPATNRCKKIASSDDVALADCGEGRERNPTTNRCRNVLASVPPAASFAVEPVAEAASVFAGWWVAGGVALAAVGYAGWEWREEIGRLIRRIASFGRAAK